MLTPTELKVEPDELRWWKLRMAMAGIRLVMVYESEVEKMVNSGDWNLVAWSVDSEDVFRFLLARKRG